MRPAKVLATCPDCEKEFEVKGTCIRHLPDPTKKRKSSETKMTPEDMAWARAVKDRDGWACQWPGCIRTKDNAGMGGIQAAHIFTRRKKATRLLEENGITLCGGHHFYAHGGGARDFILLAQDRLGLERFEELRQLAEATTKTVRRRT